MDSKDQKEYKINLKWEKAMVEKIKITTSNSITSVNSDLSRTKVVTHDTFDILEERQLSGQVSNPLVPLNPNVVGSVESMYRPVLGLERGSSLAHSHEIKVNPKKPSYKDKGKERMDKTCINDGFELDKRTRETSNGRLNERERLKEISRKTNLLIYIDIMW